MKKLSGNFRNNNNFIKRVQVLSVVVVALFLVVLLKLFQVQVINHNFYKALAQDQHEFFEKIIPERGEIFINDIYSDKIYPLAVNKELNLVYAVPKNIIDKKETAAKLSELLEMEREEIFKIINKKDDPYEVIKRKISDEAAEKIKNENIIGIKTSPEIIRYYPGNYLAANIIGFLGYSGHEKVGQYGIEGYYNEKLRGTMGFLELEKDSSGKWITFGSKSSQSPEDGDDIVLTIDQTIQYISETKLKEAVLKYGAESGNIIVMDPKTGAIIAMAQYPSFNPNEYFKEEDMSVFLNSSIHNVYEPGSIQKPITMAIGLDLGKVSPSTTYFDKGFLKIDGWPINNSDGKANGKQTMTEVLEKSLNTGAVFVQQQVEKNDFYNYLRSFKLNELTGIEIKGEAKGSLSNLDNKRDISYATASYGQGISVTPLAILTAISVFANDGKLMKPYIVSEFIGADGYSEKNEPKIVCQVVSPKTASLISAMMTSVIRNGHAKEAGVSGYKLAGKTGTAQIPKKDGKGYEEDKTIHTFVGFGPIPNPKFSILVKLDSPTNAPYAANTVAPVFSELSQELVNYYNVPASF
ncbi:MAG: penicillin-binding protein 2 [Candidatus Pacebacteria bacterium]|nr:penicillin-binding protein 2 [Candidatus Paceibacterota bacterium]